jgi:hypothetical protein
MLGGEKETLSGKCGPEGSRKLPGWGVGTLCLYLAFNHIEHSKQGVRYTVNKAIFVTAGKREHRDWTCRNSEVSTGGVRGAYISYMYHSGNRGSTSKKTHSWNGEAKAGRKRLLPFYLSFLDIKTHFRSLPVSRHSRDPCRCSPTKGLSDLCYGPPFSLACLRQIYRYLLTITCKAEIKRVSVRSIGYNVVVLPFLGGGMLM